MTRLTRTQRATVLRLFQGGSSVNNLAFAYRVSGLDIEAIIRHALLIPTAQEARTGRERS